MNPRISVVVATVFATGVSMNAGADDSSMSRFGGDGSVYFQNDGPRASAAPSTFRRETPKDVSEHEYQALSSWGPAWHPAPVADNSPATFRMSHPNGLSVREYQSLSSGSQVWKLLDSSRGSGHS